MSEKVFSNLLKMFVHYTRFGHVMKSKTLFYIHTFSLDYECACVGELFKTSLVKVSYILCNHPSMGYI